MSSAKQRLLRLSIAHYRSQNVSEEAFHRWAAEDHCARAAGIHARHGVEAYGMLFNLTATREAARELNERLGKKWVLDDHDVVVEFYLRDLEAVQRIIADPEFAKLQEEEAPWVDTERSDGGVVAHLAWVEVYVENGKVVHVGSDGKPTYARLDLGASLIPVV
ncbi:hypothetical protein SLS57_008175 [Botryosphaeria dothidea]